jgi:hypothetical protein
MSAKEQIEFIRSKVNNIITCDKQRERIECRCGAMIQRKSMKEHKRSEGHITIINNMEFNRLRIANNYMGDYK